MRVGVIGVGAMGQNHARVYADGPADLVGVSDPDVEVGRSVAKQFSTSHSADYRELLREDLDAVSVCVPTRLHARVARDAIGRGLHVLVEKPLADNVADAQGIVDTARAAGVVLAVGHVERHNPVVAQTKGALEAGAYGDLITVAARRVSSFPERVRDVGVIMDLGIHDLDVLRFLVGSPVRRVAALGGRRKHDAFEDHATILLDFENGVNGFVEVNWLTPLKVRKLALTCLESFVEVDYIAQTVTVSSSTPMPLNPFNLYHVPFEFDIRHVAIKREEPLRREIRDFLEAIEAKRDPLVTGEQAVETLRVVEAAVRSQSEGSVVEVA